MGAIGVSPGRAAAPSLGGTTSPDGGAASAGGSDGIEVVTSPVGEELVTGGFTGSGGTTSTGGTTGVSVGELSEITGGGTTGEASSVDPSTGAKTKGGSEAAAGSLIDELGETTASEARHEKLKIKEIKVYKQTFKKIIELTRPM
ncbi:MAG: hypothetical protein RR315_00430 [Oscillospiraceae bacterium]